MGEVETEPGEGELYEEDTETAVGDAEATEAGPEDPPVIEAEPEALGGLLVTLCRAAEDHFGLHVGECDCSGAPDRWKPVHRVHAPHSLHYVHRAADISGLAPNMNRYARWVATNYTPRLAELIHNPGGSVKNGRHVDPSIWGPKTWAAHRNHVHVAV